MAKCVRQSNENCTKDGLKYALLHSFSQQRASVLYCTRHLSECLVHKRDAIIISAATSLQPQCAPSLPHRSTRPIQSSSQPLYHPQSFLFL